MAKHSDFEFLEKLGKGSYGTVYKVKRKDTQQVLVIKQIDTTQLSQRMRS